jgi:hypothetical protein
MQVLSSDNLRKSMTSQQCSKAEPESERKLWRQRQVTFLPSNRLKTYASIGLNPLTVNDDK